MVKRISRRFVSLLLTFVTILTLLPAMTLPALAATSGTVTGLADENIGLEFSGDAEDAWSATGTQIVGSAIGTGGICGDTHYDSTLTITNKRTTKATLSFDYAIKQNNGTIQVDGANVTEGRKFSKELAPNANIKVYIKSGSTNAATTITMTNVKLVADATATVTFRPAENGSYTVDGTAITVDRTITQSSMIAYPVNATPADGYQFMGWYDMTHEKYISTAAETALNIESDCTITARFASKTAALFETGGQRFDDLNSAIAEAQKKPSATIVLVSDGSITGNYTIPANVTLLIPFDEAKTLYTATPNATTSQTSAKAFRTLTMAADSSITLASGAAISVGGQYFAATGGKKGQMAGSYGCIKMESGSAITVKSDASLYAWGFISGSGSVTVESGGSVYEWYQILDFRGGSASSQMGNNVFPFNQYAVQNIEVPLTMYAGSSETAYTAVNAMGGIKPTSVPFIGNNSLFKLVSGKLTKAYDGSTDRMIYTIDGEANLNSLNMNLAGVSVDSSSYVLPLTNNMTINLNSDSKLTVNQTVALLPGVEVTIARDAELVVPKGQSMYIYDVDEWGKYCGHGGSSSTFIPVVYAPGRTGTRAPLADVKMDVNGKLTTNLGRTGTPGLYNYHDIYTTASGANICSSEGTGRYIQLENREKSEKVTYQYDGSTTAHEIPITPAQLHNADGSYTLTADATSAGDTFTYCTCPDCGGKWKKNLQVAALINSDGTQGNTYKTLQEAVNNLNADQYIKMLHNTAENINAKNDLYLDLNGRTVTGKFTMNSHILHGMDNTTDDYVGTNAGKIVGKVDLYDKTIYQTGNAGDAYKRYVAIPGKEEDGTPTVSFHRFNISVSGYRFELAAPQCALFFIGKFQGDDAAKKYLTSLDITLTGDNGPQLGTYSYSIPKDKDIPEESNPGESPVVRDADDDAYLFEAYLMRDIDKGNSATYQTKFTATAQANFKNNGTQSSEQQHWSFQDAWQNPGVITDDKQKEILKNFLAWLDTPNQTE